MKKFLSSLPAIALFAVCFAATSPASIVSTTIDNFSTAQNVFANNGGVTNTVGSAGAIGGFRTIILNSTGGDFDTIFSVSSANQRMSLSTPADATPAFTVLYGGTNGTAGLGGIDLVSGNTDLTFSSLLFYLRSSDATSTYSWAFTDTSNNTASYSGIFPIHSSSSPIITNSISLSTMVNAGAVDWTSIDFISLTGGNVSEMDLSFAAFGGNSFSIQTQPVGSYWAPSAGGGGTGTWGAGNNVWSATAGTIGTLPQGTAGTLSFGGTAGTVTLSGSVSAAAGLGFSVGGYTITGGTSISLNGANASANTITTDANVGATINSVLAGSAGMTKAGGGTLTLGGANTYSGGTSVDAGTLVVDGSANNTTISVNNGGTLSGSGSVGGIVVNLGGTVSPGNVIGTQSVTGNVSLFWGGNYNWQIYDAAGTAGSSANGWDLISATGTLDLSALTVGSEFNINLWSLSSIAPTNGNAINFNPSQSYTWTILTAGGGITGFTGTEQFNINIGAFNGTGGFANGLEPGWGFTVVQDGNNLNLVYGAPIPEPGTWAAAALLVGGAAFARWRKRKTA
jgi:autotransporter-associated beta strand protein